MNEFDYEVRQRKNLARQAAHRKRGSRSKKCTLPSDGLTHKQWKERNGEVMIYNPNKPMKWNDFRALPKDIQQMYIAKLQDTYSASASMLATMFDVSPNCVSSYARKHGLTLILDGNRRSRQKLEAWRQFCNGEHDVSGQEIAPPETADEPVEAVPDEPDVDVKPEPIEHRKPTMTLDHFSLNFKGAFDPDAVRNSLAMILERGQEVEISITCLVL